VERSLSPAASKELENPEILVNFQGRDQDLLLERNAELLLAFEHIALRWLWLDPQFYGRIRFDAGGYRAMRIEELKLSARVAAGRVRETHSPFRFNAMSPRERRILHLVLKDEPGVRSESEGAGEERQVVVYPTN
jgi:spoIIIJ-associated protein